MTLWRTGFEIELLAPIGASRRDLALAIAARHPGAGVRRVFHVESEPSKVPGQPVFDNLTLGFEVHDRDGDLLARCLDDLTLQSDLDREHAPEPGWFRIVSDDGRLLRLVARHATVEAPLEDALAPVAALFGTPLERGPNGMFRVIDERGASIAIGAPLPGERHRPCELITPPLDDDRAERLLDLLTPAQELGFLLPIEGALHIHFDAKPLRDARVFRDLVRFFSRWGPELRRRVRTNPNCRRLGGWPDALLDVVEDPDFATLSWADARSQLLTVEFTKYCDFNLRNILLEPPDKDTFEVRILPTTLDVSQVLDAAALFERILVALVAGPLDSIPEQPVTLRSQ
ncbi:MAG: hypothetical protein ACI9MR_000414 [Myxococcota bacterium]